MVRKLLVSLGLIALAVAAAACSSASTTTTTTAPATTTTLPTSPSSRNAQAATRAMQAALGYGNRKSTVHYVDSASGGQLATVIVGDIGQSSGIQTISIDFKGVRSSITIELVGHTVYFKGGDEAVGLVFSLTPSQATAAADRWVSIVPSEGAIFQQAAQALTVGSLMSEIALAKPITGMRAILMGGNTYTEIFGRWVGDGVLPREHATGELVTTEGANSLPVEFSGVKPTEGISGRFVETVVLSRWGETVHIAVPRNALPLSSVLKAKSTTKPTVV